MALIWFTYLATGHKGVAPVPGLIWLVLTVRASSRTTEGDLVLADNNWVAWSTCWLGRSRSEWPHTG